MKEIFGDHHEYFEAMVQKSFWEGIKKAQTSGIARADWRGAALGIRELIAEARQLKRLDDEANNK